MTWKFTVLLLLVNLVSCTGLPDTAPTLIAGTPEGGVVEKAILWDDELDKTWAPIGMRDLLMDPRRFEFQGQQFLVLEPMVVFGHRAAYVGMKGYESVPGPNAILAGTPKSIASAISSTRGLEFRNQKGVYICDYKPNVRILIEKHPSLKGASIIIGAYTGVAR